MKKIFVLIVTLLIILLTFTLLWVFGNKIEKYDKTYILGMQDTRSEDEILTCYSLYEAGDYEKYKKYLLKYVPDKIKPIDLSRNGIVCEYIWHQGSDGREVYAVLYDNKTIKCIFGDLSGYSDLFDVRDIKLVTGRDINNEYTDTAYPYFTNVFYIKGDYEEKIYKLSTFQYAKIINMLKIINLFDVSEESFGNNYVTDFVFGLYFNGDCYDYGGLKYNNESVRKIVRYLKQLIDFDPRVE